MDIHRNTCVVDLADVLCSLCWCSGGYYRGFTYTEVSISTPTTTLLHSSSLLCAQKHMHTTHTHTLPWISFLWDICAQAYSTPPLLQLALPLLANSVVFVRLPQLSTHNASSLPDKIQSLSAITFNKTEKKAVEGSSPVMYFLFLSHTTLSGVGDTASVCVWLSCVWCMCGHTAECLRHLSQQGVLDNWF